MMTIMAREIKRLEVGWRVIKGIVVTVAVTVVLMRRMRASVKVRVKGK